MSGGHSWGRGTTNSKLSPLIGNQTWLGRHLHTTRPHTKPSKQRLCLLLRETRQSVGSYHRPAACKPGALSSGPSKPMVLAFASIPSRYGIRTCLWPLRCRLAHFWDSTQGTTDLGAGGGAHLATHAHLCVGSRGPGLPFAFFILRPDRGRTWIPFGLTLSLASPRTSYSSLSEYEEARELQMLLHHTRRDLSTCLP